MTPDLATLTFDLPPRREFVAEGPIVPVLIRVPALRTTSRQRARRRRRLRREVRLGGLVLMLGAPLVGLGLTLPRAIPSASSTPTTDTTPTTTTTPPVVSLLPDIEPVAPPAPLEASVPEENDEHWVSAWEEEDDPVLTDGTPRTTERTGAVPVVWTPGYLLPELPATEDGGREKERTHAKY